MLRVLRVVVDNGKEAHADRLVYDDEHPSTVIVIGGGTLSRGLTLEGPFVSFFTVATESGVLFFRWKGDNGFLAEETAPITVV